MLLVLVAVGACRPAPSPSGPAETVALSLETTEGTVHCALEPSKAPRAVSMVAGLARGRSPWRDPASGQTVRRPYYDGRAVFRAVEGLLVQTGCPLDNGTGDPGFRIEVEPAPDDRDRLARPGALALARYTLQPGRTDPHPPPPGKVIGAQLVVTLGDMSHLAGEVTVIGSCRDLDVVERIAHAVSSRSRPVRVARAVVGPPSRSEEH